jgi:hypothetical protein
MGTTDGDESTAAAAYAAAAGTKPSAMVAGAATVSCSRSAAVQGEVGRRAGMMKPAPSRFSRLLHCCLGGGIINVVIVAVTLEPSVQVIPHGEAVLWLPRRTCSPQLTTVCIAMAARPGSA